MREQREDEDRRDYMLLVAAEYIEQHCPEGTTKYDDADCDGYCVAEDCRIASESEEEP